MPYNFKYKFDDWCVGGRYSESLRSGGKLVDSARVGDCDFAIDEENYKLYSRIWDVVIDHKKPEPGESFDIDDNTAEYIRELYRDRESYAKYRSQFFTFAVILPDGTWHNLWDPDDLFGYYYGTPEEEREWMEHYKERFLETADPDWILTVVDCHI